MYVLSIFLTFSNLKSMVCSYKKNVFAYYRIYYSCILYFHCLKKYCCRHLNTSNQREIPYIGQNSVWLIFRYFYTSETFSGMKIRKVRSKFHASIFLKNDMGWRKICCFERCKIKMLRILVSSMWPPAFFRSI